MKARWSTHPWIPMPYSEIFFPPSFLHSQVLFTFIFLSISCLISDYVGRCVYCSGYWSSKGHVDMMCGTQQQQHVIPESRSVHPDVTGQGTRLVCFVYRILKEGQQRRQPPGRQ